MGFKYRWCKELNNWVKTQPNVYYLSYSGHASQAAPITGLHLPHITMNKVLMGNAFFLGSYARYEENRPLMILLGGKMMV